MKQKLFMLLATLTSSMQVYAMDTCFSESCSDCFGFDTVMSFEIGGGYREDQVKWKAYPASAPGYIVEEKWTGLHTGIIDTGFQFLATEHYLMKVDFDYGWWGRQGHQTIKTFTTNPEASATQVGDVHSPTKGRVYDLSGEAGYQFNSPCNTYSFAPLAGYAYHFQRLANHKYHNEDAKNPKQSQYSPNHYRYIWKGPTLGFLASWQIACGWQLALRYAYTWAGYHAKIHEVFAPGTPGVPVGSLEGKQHNLNASGNEISLNSVFEFCDDWIFGIKFDYYNFNASKAKFRGEKGLYHSVVRNVNWTSWNITADIGYVF